MAGKIVKRKYGAVILLDALGASRYTEEQIKKFLSARSEINSIVKSLATELSGKGRFHSPSIFTFGDTIIITIQLGSKKYIKAHIFGITLLMRRYLFHSLGKGILFRGAFSIGHYIEDPDSNTVMGPAVTDAASWYEQPEWMGLSCTPKTNSVLEYHFAGSERQIDFRYLHTYDVPLKGGSTFNLHTIAWPSAFFDEHLLKVAEKSNPRKYFLEILKDLPVPKGVELKYENTKKYFAFVETQIANRSAPGDGK
jgi:hypothetical protein